jgi:dihydropyrimidinase
VEFNLIIKNGTIVTATDKYVADIGIQGSKIVVIGSNLSSEHAAIIDATGKYIFPGGVDVHTHLDMPFSGAHSTDDFTTGTIAAACGGTTTIVDFCLQSKKQTLHQALDIWHTKADNKAVIDYGFHIGVADMNDAVLAEMAELMRNGYPSYKFFMTYKDFYVTDDVILKALLCSRDNGGLVSVHAENFYVVTYMVEKFRSAGKNAPKYHALSRPSLVEGEATGRAIKLARLVDAPLYVVHLTCKDALDEVVCARAKGARIMAETCPQYLLLSSDNYDEPDFNGAKYVISPPLRPKANQESLWQGLHDGNLLTVATDHCPFDFKGQKEMGRDFFGLIPNGMAGIETRMALLFDRGVNAGKISLNKFVELTATNPAKIFGMYPQKGSIAIGADADIIVFDPKLKRTITKALLHENVDYTPYEGFEVIGYPEMTISRGEVIVKNNNFIGKVGRGKFLARSAVEIL